MNTVSSISFLIPTYNDEKTIERAISEAERVGTLIAKRFEIIVINDASLDQTGLLLKKLIRKIPTLNVITHRVNQGYGRTIKELYSMGTGEWIFTIPGDYQVGAREILTLLPKTVHFDLIIGWRKKRIDPTARLVQSALYNRLLCLLFGLTIHDVNSVKLMKSHILNKLSLQSESAFVDAELIIDAKKKGFAVGEVQVAHRASVAVGSGGSFQTIFPTLKEMIFYIMKQ